MMLSGETDDEETLENLVEPVSFCWTPYFDWYTQRDRCGRRV